MTHPQSTQWAALILRVSLGVMYLAHSVLLKVLTFGLSGTAQWFASVGFPAELAYGVAFAEIIGGTMLLLWVYTRWVALALIPILLGALTVHWANGWVFSAQGGGWEYPLFLVSASIAQFLLGNGAFALSKTVTQPT